MSAAIEIKVCDDAEQRAALFEFRHRVWTSELGAQVAGNNTTQMFDAVDAAAINYAAHENQTIIGSLRITDLRRLDNAGNVVDRYHLQELSQIIGIDSISHVGRLAVDRDARGGMCLFALLAQAMRDAQQRGIRAYCFDCSPYLLRTYEALGAVRTGAAFDDPLFGFKIPMAIIHGDREYFRMIRSPLLRAVAEESADPDAIAWRAQRSINIRLMPPSDPQTLIAYIDARFQQEQIASDNLLSGLDHEQRQKLLARSTLFNASPGQEVIKSGLREDTVFLVLAGALDVRDETHPSLVLQTLDAGEFFGEMAWLTGERRHNRVIAREDSELLLISAEVLRNLFGQAPDIAAIIMRNMARTLARRLQANARRIAPPMICLDAA